MLNFRIRLLAIILDKVEQSFSDPEECSESACLKSTGHILHSLYPGSLHRFLQAFND